MTPFRGAEKEDRRRNLERFRNVPAYFLAQSSYSFQYNRVIENMAQQEVHIVLVSSDP